MTRPRWPLLVHSAVPLPVWRPFLTTMALAVVAVAPHAWKAGIALRDLGSPPEIVLPAPSGWQAVSPAAIDFRPAYINPVSELHGEFTRNQQTVGVFIGYYGNQSYERKLITSTNALVKSDRPSLAQGHLRCSGNGTWRTIGQYSYG